jgi:hypothetical protein
MGYVCAIDTPVMGFNSGIAMFSIVTVFSLNALITYSDVVRQM